MTLPGLDGLHYCLLRVQHKIFLASIQCSLCVPKISDEKKYSAGKKIICVLVVSFERWLGSLITRSAFCVYKFIGNTHLFWVQFRLFVRLE